SIGLRPSSTLQGGAIGGLSWWRAIAWTPRSGWPRRFWRLVSAARSRSARLQSIGRHRLWLDGGGFNPGGLGSPPKHDQQWAEPPQMLNQHQNNHARDDCGRQRKM